MALILKKLISCSLLHERHSLYLGGEMIFWVAFTRSIFALQADDLNVFFSKLLFSGDGSLVSEQGGQAPLW
jgi:hypothetical protein